jgi:hypothetical protein
VPNEVSFGTLPLGNGVFWKVGRVGMMDRLRARQMNGQITFFVALLGISLVGCTSNLPWRTGGEVDCTTLSDRCKKAVIETYNTKQPNEYDLAFVEFTDRGNAFSRAKLDMVLKYVEKAKAESANGVAVIVYVHGWKHNASYDDPNVNSFRQLLEILSKRGVVFGRRTIGVYVGWRGLSADMWGATNLTYWERKAVAQQVGRGGVTELLLRLRQVVSPKSDDTSLMLSDQENTPCGSDQLNQDRSLYVVIGHSFGGAIVLSSLSEVLLETLISASETKRQCAPGSCVKTPGFGHGVILLNPAIEATEGLHLKEASRTLQFPSSQMQLMHVISTDGDTATRTAFPLGQRLGMLTWSETNLQRQYGGSNLTLAETELDATTVGNFTAFRTARLQATADRKGWEIFRCDGVDHCKLDDAQWAKHIDTTPNDPLSFVSTDASFIKDHNDIFNCNVTAYLAAVVEATRVKRGQCALSGCTSNNGFDLLQCFQAYHKMLQDVPAKEFPQFCPTQR